jgi:hypothetical protein
MGAAIAAVIALTVGWLAGVLTFRIKQRWCPTCGTSLACPIGHAAPWHSPTPSPERTCHGDMQEPRNNDHRNTAPASAWREPQSSRRTTGAYGASLSDPTHIAPRGGERGDGNSVGD